MNYGKESTKRRTVSFEAKGIKIRNRIALWLGNVCLVLLVLCAVVGISAGFGLWKGIIDSAPNIEDVDVTPNGYSTTVLDCDGNQISTLVAAGANRKYVTIDEIPEDLQNAFVAIEDARFYEHNGIDAAGIMRAFAVGVKSGEFSQGASTITQQLIKNNVLTSWTSEASMIEKVQRKIQEQYLAIELEKLVNDKKWILENYLNTINLGANTLGVQAASMKYFDKDVADLTISECAVIAGITQNPSQYNPITHPESNAKRREKVLSEMRSQGYIDDEQYETAMADNVYERIAEYNTGNGSSVNSYFVDAMIDDVYNDLITELGYSESEAYKAIYQSGLTIYSTQDSSLQSIVDEEVNNPNNYSGATKYSFAMSFQVKDAEGNTKTYSHQTMLKYFRTVKKIKDATINYSSEEKCLEAIEEYKQAVLAEGGELVAGSEYVSITLQPQVAVTLIDNENGYVVALSGGRGEKEGNRTLNRATDTSRQPGSCFKIIAAYAPALDAGGLTLASTQDDAPLTIGQKEYSNWDKVYQGYTPLREGIVHSMNIVTVKTLYQIGVDLGYEYAESFGITTLVEDDKNTGLCLGGLTYGVTNLELTAAYATIANAGEYRQPKFYTKVVDHDGNVLLDVTKTQESHRVIKETTAWLLTSAMQEVLTRGTGTPAYFGGTMAQAAKTGTTTSNRDTIFQGFTPYYSCGIWGGYDDNAIQSSTTYSKHLWKAIMARVHTGLEYKGFEMPAGIVQREVCYKSGKAPIYGMCDMDPRGSQIHVEYFDTTKGSGHSEDENTDEPTDEITGEDGETSDGIGVCDKHKVVTVCSETHMLAGPRCPAVTRMCVVDVNPGSGEGEFGAISETCTLH